MKKVYLILFYFVKLRKILRQAQCPLIADYYKLAGR